MTERKLNTILGQMTADDLLDEIFDMTRSLVCNQTYGRELLLKYLNLLGYPKIKDNCQ